MKKLTIALLSLTMLQGCAAAIIAGVGAGAASVNDRRTIGAQVDDQTIEVKAYTLIADNSELDDVTRVQITSLNGTVLVVGQAPNQNIRNKVIATIKDIQGIRKLHNQIRIGNTTTIGTRTNDTWLTTKVKTELLASDKLDGTAIKVITEDSEVFLMGMVNANEANIAVEIVRNINGVARVYKAFENI
ncbi:MULTISPECIES: BON domain-containing protein [unclassified Thalassotalea]|uniref:BON domain-containing protein n=1 Tax=unclassified Thalassotalea TaxID=2614972 RepID=UPI001080E212|nr:MULTISPECIES: BON domain-containing protein [unclassified Thalassotalea]NMP15751.1 BON domain-containing protein [Thalassotalea sp. Y01]QBY04803.1 BON domain-containing protein [Thalassotalea sp. HSM 43]